jgi:hypothetical protein
VSPLGLWGDQPGQHRTSATYRRIAPNADTLSDLLEAVESGKLTVQISGTSAFDRTRVIVPSAAPPRC